MGLLAHVTSGFMWRRPQSAVTGIGRGGVSRKKCLLCAHHPSDRHEGVMAAAP